jgi:hypothetical protein
MNFKTLVESLLLEGPKDRAGKDKFVKNIAKSAKVSYKAAGAIAAAAGRKRLGAKEFNRRAAAGRRKAAKKRK